MASTTQNQTRIATRAGVTTVRPAYEGYVTMLDAKALFNLATGATSKVEQARARAACTDVLAQLWRDEAPLTVSNGKTALLLIDACAIVGVSVEMSDLTIARVAK